ncbi:coil containing protein [Vibrio phage LP.2]|nr:coil containing protein [Vibrio phage LP.2]
MACNDFPTVDDMKQLKLDSQDENTFMTSTDLTFTTSTGRTILTLTGLLASGQYLPPVPYAAGISFTEADYTKTIERNGIVYAPLPSQIPFTTSGTWTGDDENKFFVVQGVTVDSLPTYTDLVFDSVADMLNGNPQRLPLNAVATVRGTEFKRISGDGTDLSHYESLTDLYLGAFGASDDADYSAEIQQAIDTGYPINLDKNYTFTNLSIPSSAKIKGLGSLVGFNSNGAKPTRAAMESAVDQAARLTLLQAYNQNTVTFTGGGDFTGRVSIENALISGSAFTCRGEMFLVNSSSTTSITANGEGTVYADGIIISDVVDDAIFCQRGGTWHAEGAIVVATGKRGLHAQMGKIYANDASVDQATGEGAFATIGGRIFAKRLRLTNGSTIGILNLYGASSEIDQCFIDGNSGAACVSESNSAIYAENGTFTNCSKGLSTSYNGFIQARGGTITGNAGLAVDLLTGGYVNVQDAIIDTTNNGGGTQIRAKTLGFVIAEEPGTPGSGKDTLTASMYIPEYNVISNGLSLITDAEDDFTEYPANETGVSFAREIIMRRTTLTISSGEVTPETAWTLLNPESGTADNLDNIARSTSRRVDKISLQLNNSGDTITIRHNQGNIRTRDGANIVLNATAQVVDFVWNDKVSVWSQVQ